MCGSPLNDQGGVGGFPLRSFSPVGKKYKLAAPLYAEFSVFFFCRSIEINLLFK